MSTKYTDPAEFSFREQAIPRHMHGAIRRYIDFGIYPGEFLACVFSDHLVGAASCADERNLLALHVYAAYLYGCVPSGCWGSKDIVSTWIEKKGLKGLDYEYAKRA